MVVCNYTVYKLWRVGRDFLEFHPDSSKMVTPTNPRLRAIITAAMADVRLEFVSIQPSMTMHTKTTSKKFLGFITFDQGENGRYSCWNFA